MRLGSLLRLLDPSAYRFNPNALLPLSATLVLWAMLLFLGVTRGDARVRRSFALFTAIISTWSLGVAMGMSLADAGLAILLVRCVIALLALAGPVMLYFSFAVLRRPLPGVWPFVVGAAAGSALVSIVSSSVVTGVWRPPWGGFYPRVGIAFPFLLCPSLVEVACASILVIRCVGSTRGLRRRQLLYLAIAQLIGTIGASIDLAGVYGFGRFPVAWASSILSMGLIFYAIAEYRLLGIRTVAHRSLAWFSLSVLLLGPLYLFARLFGEIGLRHPLATLGLGAALLGAVRLSVGRLAPLLSRLPGGRARRALAAMVAAVGERAVDARSAEELRELLRRAVHEATGAPVGLLGARGEAGIWRTWPPLEGPPLRDADPGLAWLAAEAEPLTRDVLELLPEGELGRVLAALLDRFGADAVVPLRHAGDLVGLLALGTPPARRAPDPLFSDEELDFLRRLGEHGGPALVNARLYEEVRRRSDGLEAEVRQRTFELAQALDELKHAQARLVHAERMSALGLLVAGVSHEINNALNFIYGNLPTLGRYVGALEEAGRAYEARLPPVGGPAADPALEALGALGDRAARARARLPGLTQTLGDGARKARAIVEDLRRFARAGDDEQRVAVDLHEGLNAATNLLRSRLGGVVVERRFAADLPRAPGHPTQLNQVWMALLLNAAQAVGEGGRIEIETRVVKREIEVAVRDHGRGMRREELEHAFDPFFTTRPPGEAAGLGLTVAKDIVLRHAGRIEAESEPGKGSIFRVVLPLSDPPL